MSSAFAILAIQSNDGAFRLARTSYSWLRDTSAKSASELSAMPFFFARWRMFRATTPRSWLGLTSRP